jgi:hypothetical protein
MKEIGGKKIMKSICIKDCESQWTNQFGEIIAQELLSLYENTWANTPDIKEKLKPDLETTSFIVEVKTQTYYTPGTAGEKVLGTPFKYANVPNLYGKPLIILCIGGIDKLCRIQYGNLNNLQEYEDMPVSKKIDETQEKMLDFYKNFNITFKSASDMIRELLENC